MKFVGAGRGSSTSIDPKVGHLAIFVGTSVATKNHAEFISNMELIDAMPPGLLRNHDHREARRQAEGPGQGPAFELCIEARGLDDIRALGCNSIEDEREFAAVARGIGAQQCCLPDLCAAVDQDD